MISEFIFKKDPIAPNALVITSISTNRKPATKLILKKSQENGLNKNIKLIWSLTITKISNTIATIPIIPFIKDHTNHVKAPLQVLPQVIIKLASILF